MKYYFITENIPPFTPIDPQLRNMRDMALFGLYNLSLMQNFFYVIWNVIISILKHKH